MVEVKTRCPPSWAVRMVRLARFGEFKEDWEDYFAERYEAKLVEWTEQHGPERGKKYADSWAYKHASATLVRAFWQWFKVVFTLYMQFRRK
jgi:hypothetical protein